MWGRSRWQTCMSCLPSGVSYRVADDPRRGHLYDHSSGYPCPDFPHQTLPQGPCSMAVQTAPLPRGRRYTCAPCVASVWVVCGGRAWEWVYRRAGSCRWLRRSSSDVGKVRMADVHVTPANRSFIFTSWMISVAATCTIVALAHPQTSLARGSSSPLQHGRPHRAAWAPSAQSCVRGWGQGRGPLVPPPQAGPGQGQPAQQRHHDHRHGTGAASRRCPVCSGADGHGAKACEEAGTSGGVV
jgi:hypothetical protein